MASTLGVFDFVKQEMVAQYLSATFRCALITSGWTPSIDTSTLASLTGHFVTNLSAGNTDKQVGVGSITKTADGVIKFDLSDIAFTATSGASLCAQYGVLWKSASATSPIMYWQLSSTDVVAAIINVTWPSEGLFETSDNI